MSNVASHIIRHHHFLVDIHKMIIAGKFERGWELERQYSVTSSAMATLRTMGVIETRIGVRNKKKHTWLGRDPDMHMAKALYMRLVQKLLQYNMNRLMEAGNYEPINY